jgi:hypothetical protein
MWTSRIDDTDAGATPLQPIHCVMKRHDFFEIFLFAYWLQAPLNRGYIKYEYFCDFKPN